jgi:hypothetical protein
MDLPEYVVDLDLPPRLRWREVVQTCRTELIKATRWFLANLHNSTLMKGQFGPPRPDQYDTVLFGMGRGEPPPPPEYPPKRAAVG